MRFSLREWFDGGRLRGVLCARRSPQDGLSALRFTRASTKDHVLITPERLRFGGRACHDESMRGDIRERVTYLAEAITPPTFFCKGLRGDRRLEEMRGTGWECHGVQASRWAGVTGCE
jgi:hypothetical protein